VSSHGGVQPIWRRDGKELFYLAPDGAVMSVAIESASPLEPGTPRALFNSGVPWLNQYSDGVSQYALSADVQRFYLLEPVPSPPEGELHIVMKWDARLGH
jgi:eukaryotic-like serine/threonine-protein kinase